MYEFTMKGAWFRWSAFDATSKLLVIGSFVTGWLGLRPALHAFGNPLDIAICLMSGSGWPDPTPSVLTPGTAIWSIACLAASILLWRRFSLRQDEMFNRVQNWALSVAGLWSLAIAFAWGLLQAAKPVPAMPVTAIFWLFFALYTVTWFAAVRRWA